MSPSRRGRGNSPKVHMTAHRIVELRQVADKVGLEGDREAYEILHELLDAAEEITPAQEAWEGLPSEVRGNSIVEALNNLEAAIEGRDEAFNDKCLAEDEASQEEDRARELRKELDDEQDMTRELRGALRLALLKMSRASDSEREMYDRALKTYRECGGVDLGGLL